MILKVENLHSGYGKMIAVEDVSINVSKEEIVVLLGPNGAGKTTILRTIVGLINPMNGKIIFEGRDITKLPVLERLKLGIRYLPDRDLAFRELSVKDNLILATKSGEIDLSLFPMLANRLNDKTGNLSGGQYKMLGLAIAYHMKPKLLMIDEPSSGLFPSAKKELANVILKMRDLGVSMLIAEQDIEYASMLGDRVYFIEGGKVKGLFNKEEIASIDISKYL